LLDETTPIATGRLTAFDRFLALFSASKLKTAYPSDASVFETAGDLRWQFTSFGGRENCAATILPSLYCFAHLHPALDSTSNVI